MEITIKSQCPNCRENIVFRHESKVLEPETKVETFNEEKLMGNSFFNIMKEATLRQNDFLDDLYRMAGKEVITVSNVPKPIELVQNYFDNLRFKIKATDDPRELLKLSDKLIKTKAVVSKEVQQEIKKQKPRALALIRERVKEFNKKKK